MAINAAAQYQMNRIMTASKPELTLMLYEGAIKFCNIAIIAVEEKDIQNANRNIKKVQSIITEFRSTLDFAYPIANEFDKVYDYLYRRLVEANVRKDKVILEEVLGHLRGMRDTWKEVMNRAK